MLTALRPARPPKAGASPGQGPRGPPKPSQTSPSHKGPGPPTSQQANTTKPRAREPQARPHQPAQGPRGPAKLGLPSPRPTRPSGRGSTPAQETPRPASRTRETATAGSQLGGARGPPRRLSPTNRSPSRAAATARPARPRRGPHPGPAFTSARAPASHEGQPSPERHQTSHTLLPIPRRKLQGALGPPGRHNAQPPSPSRAGGAAGPARPAERPSPGPTASTGAASPTGRPSPQRPPGPRAQGVPGRAGPAGQPPRQPTEGGGAGEVQGAGHLPAAARAAAIAADHLHGPPTNHLTDNRHPRIGHNSTDFALPIRIRLPQAPPRTRRAPGNPGNSSPATSYQP